MIGVGIYWVIFALVVIWIRHVTYTNDLTAIPDKVYISIGLGVVAGVIYTVSVFIYMIAETMVRYNLVNG